MGSVSERIRAPGAPAPNGDAAEPPLLANGDDALLLVNGEAGVAAPPAVKRV